MAKTVNIEDAVSYFDTEVLHSGAWDEADDALRQKALNNAERILYRTYGKTYDIDDSSKWMPEEAVYEQALWMLRQDDAVQKTELGQVGVSVSGISVQMAGKPQYIAPEARRIIAEDGGSSPRSKWTVI
ncbi:hypothetical protein [Paludifilum halophilum]|uniref:Uncharacterized protein n=1 Tax=Paludifilum halophilum TaxID=1642702 RepID=A0A235B8I3_9BACL|nr:hypothetical protein [Paludifilum halophilum]OYD08542.1 hypothetical protein CHM34_06865 [Paludifilum halophilum]